MSKDLIIGGASNYTWNELKYWVNSIKKTGFDGDIVLVGTNYTKETIDKLSSEGVILSMYGKKMPNGDIVAHSNGAPHVERFFYIWNYLENMNKDYRYVITTDTRDVIFQTNPSTWLHRNLCTDVQYSTDIVVSSEGMRYKNEPWGDKNLLETFGPYFHNILKENMIYNVGTIAGNYEHVKGLLSFIFHLSINRPIPIVDQAVFNFIINTPPFNSNLLHTSNDSDWAIQLGTTINAVKAGKGDLGAMFKSDPDKYKEIYEDKQPLIEDGFVLNPNCEKYCIVHQYDRIPELKVVMEKMYES
jgi:hypothetical protein